jgi:hypothetical protein
MVKAKDSRSRGLCVRFPRPWSYMLKPWVTLNPHCHLPTSSCGYLVGWYTDWRFDRQLLAACSANLVRGYVKVRWTCLAQMFTTLHSCAGYEHTLPVRCFFVSDCVVCAPPAASPSRAPVPSSCTITGRSAGCITDTALGAAVPPATGDTARGTSTASACSMATWKAKPKWRVPDNHGDGLGSTKLTDSAKHNDVRTCLTMTKRWRNDDVTMVHCSIKICFD